jgi:outer membrane protein assembly factor BamB
MFHYNPQHTGRCPYVSSKNDGTLKWRYKTVWQITSPAIASDGRIYMESWSGYLYAIGSTGKTHCIITASAGIGGPILPSGNIPLITVIQRRLL